MRASVEWIAELEWANYAATRALAQVTPGLEVVLRNDVILTSSRAFPTPDTNHACLLRASPEGADGLIAEVTAYFGSRNLPVVIYVSPACTPGDLSERLVKTGFNRQVEQEAWMVLKDLPNFDIPPPFPGITVKSITESEAIIFAEVFMDAFDLPSSFAPLMAQLLEPSVGLPGVHHYIALEKDQRENSRPIGTCSLIRHGSFGVLGSTAVLSKHRGRGGATTLAVRALNDARDHGVLTVMLQTAANTWLERFLRVSGFERAFTRRCYAKPHALSDESPG